MNLNLRGFSQLVEDMGAALQSSASSLIDVSVGSVTRAIFEANASVVLWLQWLILQVLQSTRAGTSSGADLDSWMLDFGLIRLPAIPSTGLVTFSRFAANLSANIPLGTILKTTDGALSFSVTEDVTISVWQASASTYTLPPGVSSVDLPVTCNTGGSVGNVLIGTITVIAASLPGIDQAYNASPLSDGADAEADPAFRSRFQNYLASRSRATLTAVQNAVYSVRQGLDVLVEENVAPDGTPRAGSFLVIVDDGTGTLSADLLTTIIAAVDAVRPIGTTFAVIAPQLLLVNVSLTAVLGLASDASLIGPLIQNYVATYLNSLTIGSGASVTRVAQNAYLAGSAVMNVTGIQLNGLPSDVAAVPASVIKAGEIVIIINDR